MIVFADRSQMLLLRTSIHQKQNILKNFNNFSLKSAATCDHIGGDIKSTGHFANCPLQ